MASALAYIGLRSDATSRSPTADSPIAPTRTSFPLDLWVRKGCVVLQFMACILESLLFMSRTIRSLVIRLCPWDRPHWVDINFHQYRRQNQLVGMPPALIT